MKVVYVLHSTLSSGGATKSFHIMINNLIVNGIEPLIVVPDGNDFCLTLRSQGIRTLVLNYRTAAYPKAGNIKGIALFLPKLIARIVVNRIAAFKLKKEAKLFGANMIHTNVSVIDIGMRAARKLGIPHVTHIREYGDKDFNINLFPSRRIYLNNFKDKNSYTICITKDIAKYYHIDNQSNSKVIYNGILNKSDMIFDKEKDHYFLFAGRLEEGKGISDIIKTYGKLRCEREKLFPLLIAGDACHNNYVDYLHELADSHGVADYIRFLGNRDDVLFLMSKAAALVVPSHHEGFGRITAEAMFSGCLVIGKDVAGTKEQFDNGSELTGKEIGLRYHNDNELIKHLCDIMDKGIEPYLPMIERAQETVGSLYTPEQNLNGILDFYNEILKKRETF